MRFLADEHIPRHVVMTLRAQGHDVNWVVETRRQGSDPAHLKSATDERRSILTEDADFSQLVQRAVKAGYSLPVALYHYRLEGLSRDAKQERMISAVAEIGGPPDRFTIFTIQPSRIRRHKP